MGAVEVRIRPRATLPVSHAVLPDGRRLIVRPIRPRDRRRLRGALLRPPAERCRLGAFVRADRRIMRGAGAFFRVDPPHSVFYIALVGRPNEERIVAICGWREVLARNEVEMMIGLLDGLGETAVARETGRALLDQVRAAAARYGITQLRAYVLPEDLVLQDVFEHSGIAVFKDFSRGCYEYSIPVSAVSA